MHAETLKFITLQICTDDSPTPEQSSMYSATGILSSNCLTFVSCTYYISNNEVLPQRGGPTVFASNIANLYNRVFPPPFRLGMFLFPIVKQQKRYQTFKITYMNIQCSLIITSGFKSKHKGTQKVGTAIIQA
jgi:hypothetical protein